MRAPLPVALVSAGLIGAVWIAVGGLRRNEAGTAAGAPTGGEAASAGASLEEGAAGPLERLAYGADGGPLATLVVRVIDVDLGTAVFGEPLLALRDDARPDPSLGSVAHLGQAPRTDASGEATFVLPAGAYRIANARRDAEVEVRLAPEERSEVRLAIASMTMAFHAQVVDATTGEPIQGARIVWGGTREAAESRADGSFASRVWRHGGDNGRLERKGYAPAELHASDEHARAAQALRIPLKATARLAGIVRGSDARALADVQVVVRTNVDVIGAQPPRTLERTWVTRTSRSGGYSFEALPSASALSVELLAEGAPMPLVRTVRLEPREKRRLDVELTAGATLRGRLLSHDREPCATKIVDLFAGDIESGAALPLVLRTWTDENGEFAFAHVQPGLWSVVPVAWAGEDGLSPEPRVLELTEGRGTVELELVAEPPLYVSGTCVGPDDQPLPGIVLLGDPTRRGASVSTRTDEIGAFTLGPFPAGQATLSVPGGQHALEETLVVEAGARGVLLRLVDALDAWKSQEFSSNPNADRSR